MKATCYCFVFILLVFNARDSYSQNKDQFLKSIIDTNVVYIGIQDSIYLIINNHQDSLVREAFSFIRFFSNGRFFISMFLSIFPDDKLVNNFSVGYKGYYKTRKDSCIIITYTTDNPFPYRKRKYLCKIEKGDVIFLKQRSGNGLIWFWKRLNNEEFSFSPYKMALYNFASW